MTTQKIQYNPYKVCGEDGKTPMGRTIVKVIRKRNMTQEQLRRLCGVSSSVISRVINGKRIPSWKCVLKISEVLGISIIELLGGEVPAPILCRLILENAKRYTRDERTELVQAAQTQAEDNDE